MISPLRRPRFQITPIVETLEGRVVLSHMPAIRATVVARAINPSDGSGAGAILGALNGGVGNEFVTLIKKQVRNVNSVVLQFATGQRSTLTVKGFSIKSPHFATAYAGPHLDQFNPAAAGAVFLKDGRLELAAILRGPIDRPEPTTYVWGLDRGGAAVGPDGFGPAGVRYDAYVSVTRSGSDLSVSFTDLKTGKSTAIDASSVRIAGPTIRVFLSNPEALLSANGKTLSKARFAFWTRSGPAGLGNLGGSVPDSGTIPIGVLDPRLTRR
ncbi:MAG: hypothetical protein JWN86_1693 [Planctomycetota bacterium]|nr:hypothetical protein [Planctomycetota bacterium]